MGSNSNSSDMLTAYLFARNFIVLLVGSAKCVELIWESRQVAIKNLAIIIHLLFIYIPFRSSRKASLSQRMLPKAKISHENCHDQDNDKRQQKEFNLLATEFYI